MAQREAWINSGYLVNQEDLEEIVRRISEVVDNRIRETPEVNYSIDFVNDESLKQKSGIELKEELELRPKIERLAVVFITEHSQISVKFLNTPRIYVFVDLDDVNQVQDTFNDCCRIIRSIVNRTLPTWALMFRKAIPIVALYFGNLIFLLTKLGPEVTTVPILDFIKVSIAWVLVGMGIKCLMESQVEIDIKKNKGRRSYIYSAIIYIFAAFAQVFIVDLLKIFFY